LCCALSLTAAATAWGQEQTVPARDLRRDAHLDTQPMSLSPTPEMWLYEQERQRYESPKGSVRRKAEFRASQRQGRIAAMKWFGQSNSRPTATLTPLTGSYSPSWTANSADPNQWKSNGNAYTVGRSGGSTY
jgi:hypothetical protein